jgi:hypothetical protein
MQFKDKLNEIFGIADQVNQEAPPKRDVIELTPIDDFRNNIRSTLNNIKSNSITNNKDTSPQIKQPMPPISCGGDVIVERQNEIGVDTLKGSVKKMGPKVVSEIIAKLSVEKKEVDASTGIATSEFDQFVDGLKQEACEVLLGSSASPSQNSTSPSPAAAPTPNPSDNTQKPPEQKLPDLVTSKL